MFFIGALLSIAHQPIFNYGSHHSFAAEPSIALYTRGSTDVSVSYRENDSMYASVLQPTMLGLQLDAPLDTVYVQPPECFALAPRLAVVLVNGTRPCTHSHMADNAPGTRMYEPFGESELTTVATPMTEKCATVPQICVYKIRAHADNPLVFVAGTKEEIGDLWITGLPIHVEGVSHWIGNYAYGYAFLAYFLTALVLLFFSTDEFIISKTLGILAIVFYLTSATSRICQIAVAGFGIGQLFSVAHWLFALGIACTIKTRSPTAAATLFVLSLATPLRLYLVEPCLLVSFWIALELGL